MLTSDLGSRKHDNVDHLLQYLKDNDAEWLESTVKARHAQLASTQSHDIRPFNARQQSAPVQSQRNGDNTQIAVWPFDLTLRDLGQHPNHSSDYIRFIHDYDWSKTELGPMSEWDSNFRRKINMCLHDKQAAALWIGPKFVCFYNETYVALAGKKHPHCLGRSFRDMWDEPSIVESFESLLLQSYQGGVSTAADSVPVVIDRHGYREELWLSFSITPIPSQTGEVFGSYTITSDNTEKEVSRRRLSMLLRLSQAAAQATFVDELWQQLLATCESEVYDVPFAVLYAADHSAETTISETDAEQDNDFTRLSWRLQGSIGLPPNYTGLPELLAPQSTAELISSAFEEALGQRHPYPIHSHDNSLPPEFHRITKSRVHGDQCQSAVLFPIAPSTSNHVSAFIILGLNPLCKYDADYEQFLDAVMRQCTTSLASLLLIEEQINFTERLAKDLTAKQEEIFATETRFQKMADHSPVAMFHLDPMGRVLYANSAWRELTAVPADESGDKAWLEFVHLEDRGMTDKEFTKLTLGQSVSFELRWKRPSTLKQNPHLTSEQVAGSDMWTLASAYPEVDIDGKVKGIYGCLTDITPQKWMQDFQKRELKDALELKRQQENFMDMISHETRNPLSAIMLTVESIMHELDGLETTQESVTVSRPSIDRLLENTDIIMTCVQHQKRIVDDVLTLSKFDSGLLNICPTPSQPEDVLAQAAKLFDAEYKKHDITMDIVTDKTYHDVVADWVNLDPSRLQQVVINLITNAVKFTATEPERKITVVLSASLARPTSSLRGCPYVQNSGWDDNDATSNSDRLFLSIEVIDTGRGMTAKETAKLFHKFQQASPKTYAKYGGSGLGLFICKQLCRLQGGAIGAASILGKGATFAFYIEAARCAAPAAEERRMSVSVAAVPRKPSTHIRPVRSKSNTSETSDGVSGSANPAAARQVHILLVEDNLINQRIMRTMLQRAKYNVSVANHGLEALDHISKTQFAKADGLQLDVVLLDVEMPVCDGMECARRIRQQEKDAVLTAHVPVIGVTANARAEQQQQAMEAGMDAVVTKPFTLKELIAKLHELDIRPDTPG